MCRIGYPIKMKIFFTISYILILIVFAAISVISTWATDEFTVFLIEIYVDVTLISGCLIYLTGRRLSLWFVLLVPAIWGQIHLLFYIEESSLNLGLLWCFVLFPAIYLNLKTDKYFFKFLDKSGW